MNSLVLNKTFSVYLQITHKAPKYPPPLRFGGRGKHQIPIKIYSIGIWFAAADCFWGFIRQLNIKNLRKCYILSV